MTDLIERLLAGPQPDRHSGVIMEEAADEIERLRQCLKWQQDRDATVGTHGPECYTWGHRHYECALREIEKLRSVMRQSEPVATYYWRPYELQYGVKFDCGEVTLKDGDKLYLHPPKPDTEELEALRKQVVAYESVTADMRKQLDEQVIALINCANRNKRYRAVMEQALAMLEHCNMEGWMLADYETQMYEALTALREALNTTGDTNEHST